MIVRCKSCARHFSVALGRDNAAREEIAGFAALAGTCTPEKRQGNSNCYAAQRYEELRARTPQMAEECP